MIRTEREYRAVLQDLEAARQISRQYRDRISAEGYGADEIVALMAPVQMHLRDLEQEVLAYQDTRAGHVPPMPVGEIGRLLTSLRIAHGLTQEQLAVQLGVHWTQVSRDERHDYHGITQDRLNRILAALGEDILYIRESEYLELCRRAGATPFASLPAVPTLEHPLTGTLDATVCLAEQRATPAPATLSAELAIGFATSSMRESGNRAPTRPVESHPALAAA
jgi:transcriptional regulator with XRE-family HTH domain